jgi:stearoyl-CoA desaturase (delta-9 desaturase)
MALDTAVSKVMNQPAAANRSAAGAARPSERSRKLIRAIGSAVVLVPPLGFVAALVVMRQTPVSIVQHVSFLFLYVGTLLGLSVGFHRYCSHHAFRANKIVRALLVIFGSMAAQGPVVYWVANHRRHHSYTDKEGDVHSPHLHGGGFWGTLHGLWHAHTGWIFEASMTDWARYVPDLLKDRLIFNLNRFYLWWILLGLALPAVIGGLYTHSAIGALQGFLWGGLGRVFVVDHVTWAINSYCHAYGKRAFDTPDKSTNNFVLALLAMGEGWHNNHHAYPPSAIFGLKWWQVDAGALLVRILEKFGWVSDLRRAPAALLAKRNLAAVAMSAKEGQS